MNVTYCPSTGKPYTLEYDDKVSVGIHKKGLQVSIPLGSEEWSLLVMHNIVQLHLNSEAQLDQLIERLNKLKKLKELYNKPNEELLV